jgi:uncharacterized coiled-coil DUF342 family protein
MISAQERSQNNLAMLRKVRQEIAALEPEVRELLTECARGDQMRAVIRQHISIVNSQIDLLNFENRPDPDPKSEASRKRGEALMRIRNLEQRRDKLMQDLRHVPGDRNKLIALDNQLTRLRQAERNIVSAVGGNLDASGGAAAVR